MDGAQRMVRFSGSSRIMYPQTKWVGYLPDLSIDKRKKFPDLVVPECPIMAAGVFTIFVWNMLLIQQ